LPSYIFSKIEEVIPDKISLPWNKEQEIQLDGIKVEQKDLEKLGKDGLAQVRFWQKSQRSRRCRSRFC
jgi:hypothetical protein